LANRSRWQGRNSSKGSGKFRSDTFAFLKITANYCQPSLQIDGEDSWLDHRVTVACKYGKFNMAI
jgi:hypothetical protein